MVRVGSRNETPQEYGLAHYLEHMLFKGNRTYPTYKKLNLKLDQIHAETNACCALEHGVDLAAPFGSGLTHSCRRLSILCLVLATIVRFGYYMKRKWKQEHGAIVKLLSWRRLYFIIYWQHVKLKSIRLCNSSFGVRVGGTSRHFGSLSEADFKLRLRQF